MEKAILENRKINEELANSVSGSTSLNDTAQVVTADATTDVDEMIDAEMEAIDQQINTSDELNILYEIVRDALLPKYEAIILRIKEKDYPADHKESIKELFSKLDIIKIQDTINTIISAQVVEVDDQNKFKKIDSELYNNLKMIQEDIPILKKDIQNNLLDNDDDLNQLKSTLIEIIINLQKIVKIYINKNNNLSEEYVELENLQSVEEVAANEALIAEQQARETQIERIQLEYKLSTIEDEINEQKRLATLNDANNDKKIIELEKELETKTRELKQLQDKEKTQKAKLDDATEQVNSIRKEKEELKLLNSNEAQSTSELVEYIIKRNKIEDKISDYKIYITPTEFSIYLYDLLKQIQYNVELEQEKENAKNNINQNIRSSTIVNVMEGGRIFSTKTKTQTEKIANRLSISKNIPVEFQEIIKKILIIVYKKINDIEEVKRIIDSNIKHIVESIEIEYEMGRGNVRQITQKSLENFRQKAVEITKQILLPSNMNILDIIVKKTNELDELNIYYMGIIDNYFQEVLNKLGSKVNNSRNNPDWVKSLKELMNLKKIYEELKNKIETMVKLRFFDYKNTPALVYYYSTIIIFKYLASLLEFYYINISGSTQDYKHTLDKDTEIEILKNDNNSASDLYNFSINISKTEDNLTKAEREKTVEEEEARLAGWRRALAANEAEEAEAKKESQKKLYNKEKGEIDIEKARLMSEKENINEAINKYNPDTNDGTSSEKLSPTDTDNNQFKILIKENNKDNNDIYLKVLKLGNKEKKYLFDLKFKKKPKFDKVEDIPEFINKFTISLPKHIIYRPDRSNMLDGFFTYQIGLHDSIEELYERQELKENEEDNEIKLFNYSGDIEDLDFDNATITLTKQMNRDDLTSDEMLIDLNTKFEFSNDDIIKK
jgi:hypothetical protein